MTGFPSFPAPLSIKIQKNGKNFIPGRSIWWRRLSSQSTGWSVSDLSLRSLRLIHLEVDVKRRQLLQALALPLFLIGREPDLAQFFALGQMEVTPKMIDAFQSGAGVAGPYGYIIDLGEGS